MQIGARAPGSLVAINVTTGGKEYKTPPVVTIAGGTGATAVAHLDNGRVQSVVIQSGGSGFTSSPAITISPQSAAATISSFTAGTTNGTVTLAADAATTFARISAGTQSVSISSFSNATQVVIGSTTFATSGGATLFAAGTGAAATAFAYTGALRPISFFKGRFNDLYGVDGMGRGFRWNGVDASVEKLGIVKPAVGPALVAASTASGGYVAAVQMVLGGAGYASAPEVVFTGGTPVTPARGRAYIANGRVTRVAIVERGSGYQDTPTVSFTGGIGSGATFAVTSIGRVSELRVLASGRGYTTSTSCTANTDYVFNCQNHGLLAGSTFIFTSVHAATTGVTISSFTAGTTSGTLTLSASAASTWTGVTSGASSASIVSAVNATQFEIGTTSFSASGAGVLIGVAPGVTTERNYYAVTVGGNTFTAGTTTGGSTNILAATLAQGVITIPPARVEFATTGGLTAAFATVSIDTDSGVSSAVVQAAGTGLTASTVTASVVGGAGTGAQLQAILEYSVSGVSVGNSGSGYFTAPVLTFRAATTDSVGSGAAATVSVNAAGNVSAVSMVAGGRYSAPPTAIILDTTAKAQATVTLPMRGKYQCAIRYLDDTPKTEKGPIPSSISELVEIDIADPADSLTWTFSHYGLDDRVAAMELWRTTADQAVALYRVATIQKTDANWSGQYVDGFADPDLQDSKREGFAVMPIVLPSGQINARRFGVLPGEFAAAAMFQDRAWFAVDASGARPNALLYSEVDEPESVPPENELVLQENTLEPDRIVGLIPLSSQLLIAQSSHLYALSYVSQPIIDASMILVAYRGMLNAQCGDVLGGVAVMADSYGMYAFDGNNAEAISIPVDNYWRDNIIDFSQSAKFHVRGDSSTMTARFFYCRSGDTNPVRALCYCMNTKAWWEETYPVAVTAACVTSIGRKSAVLSATATGQFVKSSGLSDSGVSVPYAMRTGNLALSTSGDRAIAFLYKPTTTTSTLHLQLHYNNSASPRPNAIQTNAGGGFVAGSTSATLDMKLSRSALGDATGFAQAHYSGRVDDRSAGADRHLAVAISGEQSADPVTVFAVKVNGAE